MTFEPKLLGSLVIAIVLASTSSCAEPEALPTQSEAELVVVDDAAAAGLGIALIATSVVGVVACQDASENVWLCGSVRHLRRDLLEGLATIINGTMSAGALTWEQCTKILVPLRQALASKTADAGAALAGVLKQLATLGPQTTVGPGDLETLQDEQTYHSFVPELRKELTGAASACRLVRFTTTVLPHNYAPWTTFMNNRELAIYVNVPTGKNAQQIGSFACNKLSDVFFSPGKKGFAGSKANHGCKEEPDTRATAREATGMACPGLRVCVDAQCVNFL